MKWAVNNPDRFKSSKVGISSRRVFAAFLLGFCQAAIAAVIEVCVIIYLSSLKSLITIIMKFVSLAAIVKFDNMYAAALFEEKMLGAKGKLLPT